jgi:hypothetical protein
MGGGFEQYIIKGSHYGKRYAIPIYFFGALLVGGYKSWSGFSVYHRTFSQEIEARNKIAAFLQIKYNYLVSLTTRSFKFNKDLPKIAK